MAAFQTRYHPGVEQWGARHRSFLIVLTAMSSEKMEGENKLNNKDNNNNHTWVLTVEPCVFKLAVYFQTK